MSSSISLRCSPMIRHSSGLNPDLSSELLWIENEYPLLSFSHHKQSSRGWEALKVSAPPSTSLGNWQYNCIVRHKYSYIDTIPDKDKDTDKDTDKETDMDKNTDQDTDTDTDVGMDLDMDFELKLEYFCKISIRCYSPYRAIWTIWDTPRRKFQRRYKLVVLLHNENNSYCLWNCFLNDVLADLEILL
jgi:hypothetical protein